MSDDVDGKLEEQMACALLCHRCKKLQPGCIIDLEHDEETAEEKFTITTFDMNWRLIFHLIKIWWQTQLPHQKPLEKEVR